MSIRFATVEDAAALVAIYAPYVENTTVSFEYTVPSVAEFAQRIGSISSEYPYLVYEENGHIYGYAYAHRYMERAAFNWDVEVSVYLEATAQHQGLGTKLYQRVLALLQLQNVKQAYALICSENIKSLKMHEKMGFKAFATFERVGYKFNCWHALTYLVYEVNEGDCAPEPVLNINSLPQEDLKRILEG